jgi:two-component system, chemotaxis family, protein-glutamate methylesterase/glutaminase
VAIVQDPATAVFPNMPLEATRRLSVDHIVPISEIALILAKLASTNAPQWKLTKQWNARLRISDVRTATDPFGRNGKATSSNTAAALGHVYSPLSLAKEQEDVTERFLWETMISLEDAAETAERLVVELGPQYLEEAQRKRAQAADIRRMLGSPEPGK